MRIATILIRALVVVSITIGTCINAAERITHFHSAITINEDSSMKVIETIQVVSAGRQIKRGIVREFPTRYRDTFGTHYAVGFSVQEVLHNGKPARYHTESAYNGVRVFIGEQLAGKLPGDVLLSPGKHTYTITYTTNRQLGYYPEHDELFWNVTGNGWRLPIEYASFQVTFPVKIAAQNIRTTAYTGYQDGMGRDFAMSVGPDGTVVGNTTRVLLPEQGLTIVVAWPKGIVSQPTFMQNLWSFAYDNLLLMSMLVMLMGIFFIYVLLWTRQQKPGTIIPLFHPPEGRSVADIACIDGMQYTYRALSASIVNLAVNGLVKIEQKSKPSFFNAYSSYYVLHKIVDKIPFCAPAGEKLLFGKCFPRGTAHIKNSYEEHVTHDTKLCALIEENENFIAAMDAFTQTQKRTLDHYIDTRSETWSGLVIITVVVFLAVFIASSLSFFPPLNELIFFALICCALALHGWGFWLIKTYTPEGRVLKDQIEGFKMFLQATEAERLKIIGTAPTQTPELYEKYLPYAIALGVEEQWTHQFAAVFDRLKQAGHDYRPGWYYGSFGHRYLFYPNLSSIRSLQSSRFASGASSKISSSGTRPGSRSGFGGGGGAGRGGGGGGGGGW